MSSNLVSTLAIFSSTKNGYKNILLEICKICCKIMESYLGKSIVLLFKYRPTQLIDSLNRFSNIIICFFFFSLCCPISSLSLCSSATWSVVFSQLSIFVFQGFCFCCLRLQIRSVVILVWEMRNLMILRSPLCWLQFYSQVEESMAIYVASRRLSGGTTATALRYATSLRSYSTLFREERDTFGPIQVPSDKLGIWSLPETLISSFPR